MLMQYIRYGFLSENSKFSKICQEHGIKFIEVPEMIDRMGDKASAKSTMIEAGVPCVPGSVGILESFEQTQEIAKSFGYPVMLKATAGGGKGMRAVWKEEDLLKAWEGARQESAAASVMTVCILKINRRATSYRNLLLVILMEKHVIFLREIVPFNVVTKTNGRNTIAIYDR
jgi:biotin carboxylase